MVAILGYLCKPLQEFIGHTDHMKFKSFRFFLLTSLLLLPLPLLAVTVDNLFEVRLLVEDQGSRKRQDAIKDAFHVLLVRVTGNRNINTLPEGEKLISNANQYIRQFRYEKAPPPKVMPGAQGDFAPAAPQQQLVVLFDEEAVKSAIWANKLPVWGKTRPATVVWLAVQDTERRYLLDANEPNAIVDELQDAARVRGLPIMFPLMDLEDQININVSDVWGDFPDPIMAASLRYQTEAILAGRLFVDAFDQWQARWTLYHAGNTLSWRSSGAQVKEVIDAGIAGAADDLALRYASISDGEDSNVLRLQIAEVNNLKDYVRTTNYLASLSQVGDLQIEKVSPADVTYKMSLRGSRESLEKAIGLGQTLALNRNVLATAGPNMLHYRLVP